MKSIREALLTVVKNQDTIKLDRIIEKSKKILKQEINQDLSSAEIEKVVEECTSLIKEHENDNVATNRNILLALLVELRLKLAEVELYPSGRTLSVSESESSESLDNPLGGLINDEWQIILNEDLGVSVAELKLAIEECKKQILETDECSSARSWLVRQLVELRCRLSEIEVGSSEKKLTGAQIILGHHFKVIRKRDNLMGKKIYCDHCCQVIWSIIQYSFECSCSYIVHMKCLRKVQKICAHVIVAEKKVPNQEICPEIGLSNQYYRCECNTQLMKKPNLETRLCDYSGVYNCYRCHWNDNSIIPARIVHNWDFEQQKVSRASLQEINIFYEKPVINLELVNPKIFIFVNKLSLIKRVRENLVFMKNFIVQCRMATQSKLMEQKIGTRRYLIQSSDFYSIYDLVCVENNSLIEFLRGVYEEFNNHIRNCELCQGHGYLCEICHNNEIIYPFDEQIHFCNICNSCVHRACWRRGVCGKCSRVEERNKMAQKDSS